MASDPSADLHAILTERFRPPRPGEFHDNLDLGPTGFGLDSIALIELLVICEERFGCPFPHTLLETGPFTVGALVAHAKRTGSTVDTSGSGFPVSGSGF